MDLTSLQFLIDENVPYGLLRLFRSRKIKCKSIQNLGWNGFSDNKIAAKLSYTKKIFITRDKDFQFLWEKYNLRIIHLQIEPATLKYIIPAVTRLIENWNFDPKFPFLIIVQNDVIRIRTKN